MLTCKAFSRKISILMLVLVLVAFIFVTESAQASESHNNSQPDPPEILSPTSEIIALTNPLPSIRVTDPDGDLMDVYFFDDLGPGMENLVGWWTMDKTKPPLENTVWDLDYGNNNGTAKDDNSSNVDGNTPPQSTIGMFENALDFDGIDDYVDCGNSSSLDVSGNQITLSAWIYSRDISIEGGIIDKGYGVYELIQYANGKILFRLRENNFFTSHFVSENSWYHVVATYDGNKVSLYMNGVESYSTSWSDNIPSSSHPVYIGTEVTFKQNAFNGIIDEPKIYDRALSRTEIESLYIFGIKRHFDIPSSSTTSMELKLARGDVYSFYARSYDGLQWSEPSSIKSFVVNSLPTISDFMINDNVGPTQISDSTPKFSWTYKDLDGDNQSHWQIKVGTLRGDNDVWDSGIVSGENSSIVYAGSPITNPVTYFVGVKVKDGREWGDWYYENFQIDQPPIPEVGEESFPWAWVSTVTVFIILLAVLTIAWRKC